MADVIDTQTAGRQFMAEDRPQPGARVGARPATTARSPAADRGGPVASTPGHSIMFVVLSLMSFAIFAPTVLCPLIREHGELRTEETRLQKTLADIQMQAKHNDLILDAFRHDPRINERLAVLDLRYQRPGEEILPVLPMASDEFETPPETDAPAASSLQIPKDWPSWAHSLDAWGDRHGVTSIFLNPQLRFPLLLMSGGLLVAAFVLFAPKPLAGRSKVTP